MSVLTRLPTGLRASPTDAGRLLAAPFAAPLLMSEQTARNLPDRLSGFGIAGGAADDALVPLAARLMTRSCRWRLATTARR